MIPKLSLPAVRNLWRALILGLGGLHTTVAALAQSMGSDGINYLQMGEAYWRGDWGMAINGIWSPLYGVLAGGVLTLVAPATDWVFPTVQVLNFLIFLTSLFCFEFFWGEARRSYASREDPAAALPIHAPLWWSLGYALFLWAALNLIEIWAVTPDMLVASSVYLSAGFLIRTIRKGSLSSSAGLGLALGLGYLAKAPMFPLSLACFALGSLAVGSLGRAVRRMAPAVLVFLLLTAPFLITLSVKEGHPTFSEVSRFTYLKHVNRIPYPRWREDAVVGLGTPLHPPRLVHESPDVYEYSGPVRGWYPPAFDPNYFTEGLHPQVRLADQISASSFNLAFFFRLFFRAQGVLLGIALLLLVSSWRSFRTSLLHGEWYLLLWAVACFAMYSLVFVTERYVAPFVVLIWAGFLSSWRMERPDQLGRLATPAGWISVLALLVNVFAMNLDGFVSVAGIRRPLEGAPVSQFSSSPPVSPPEVAAALKDAGVEPGVDVGLVGYGFTAFWAYLADLRIVAEVPPEEGPEFWGADGERLEDLMEALRSTGAAFLVAEVPPVDRSKTKGWIPLGGTGLWLFRLVDDQTS